MKYFNDYRVALEPGDLASRPEARAQANDSPALSFEHLGDRRFEVLVYRLKCRESSRVTLMQGVGERGRDVLVYGADGLLRTIVQCKLLKERLTYPELLGELLKLSVHCFLDPTVVPNEVTYEIWCPGDFSEPAAALVDSWPRGWTESELREPTENLLLKYSAFRSLSWADVRESVLSFPKLISTRKLSAVDITVLLRLAPEIFDDFFVAKMVVPLDDLRRELSNIIHGDTVAGQAGPNGKQQPPPMPDFFRAPYPPNAFTSRPELMSCAREIMLANKIAVVAGAGGIGKSVIAAALARDVESDGFAVYWLDGSHVQQQISMLAFTLGVAWNAASPNKLQRALEQIRACLVIDNLVFSPELCGLPQPNSRLCILLTTRERGILSLLPHEGQVIDVPIFSPEQARRFLRTSVGLPFPWSDAEVDLAAQICGNFPLALTLLASSLRKNMMDCGAILAKLTANPVDVLDLNTSSAQQGIQSTFALALAKLSVEERRSLIGLAVCARKIWVDVIAFACQQSKDITDRSLTSLESVSLVERDSTLWRMHDVIRYLCLRQPEAAEFAIRHDTSAMRLVVAHQAPEDWALIEANLEEILVAVERLTNRGLGCEVAEIVRLLIPHLRERGVQAKRTGLIELLCHMVLPHLPETSLIRASIVGHLGLCAYENGDRAAANELLEESLELYEAQGSMTGVLTTVANMANLAESDGDLDGAADKFRQAADALQKSSETTDRSNDDGGELARFAATARLNLVRVEAMRGNLDVALNEVETVLSATSTPALLDIHARALAYKSRILSESDRMGEAFETGRHAVRELQEAGLATELLATLLQLCHTAVFAGFLKNLFQVADHVIRLAKAMNDWDALYRGHSYRAWGHLLLQKKQEAIEEINAANQVALRANIPQRARDMTARIESEIHNLPNEK